MNKTEIEFIKATVRSKVKCVNGEIEALVTKRLKVEDLTPDEKLEAIRKGKAKLLSAVHLSEEVKGYHMRRIGVLLECFSYTLPAQLKKNAEHNKRLRERADELMLMVEQEGEMLIADVVLKKVPPGDLTQGLVKIAGMVSWLK